MAKMDAKDFKRRREDMEMSQERLAVELGVSQQAISLWENGQRPIPNPIQKLFRIVEASRGGAD